QEQHSQLADTVRGGPITRIADRRGAFDQEFHSTAGHLAWLRSQEFAGDATFSSHGSVLHARAGCVLLRTALSQGRKSSRRGVCQRDLGAAIERVKCSDQLHYIRASYVSFRTAHNPVSNDRTGLFPHHEYSHSVGARLH